MISSGYQTISGVFYILKSNIYSKVTSRRTWTSRRTVKQMHVFHQKNVHCVYFLFTNI